MAREPRRFRFRCEECRRSSIGDLQDDIRAEIRRMQIALVWHIAEAVFALALAAAIGALLLWSSAKHAEHYEELTQPRGLNDDGSSD